MFGIEKFLCVSICAGVNWKVNVCNESSEKTCDARYEKELGEIHSLFRMEDFASNERLDAKFFMGFYCQKQDFYKKATKETEE